MKAQLLFVGECRSLTAQRKGWTWHDGRLAAKPLFEALEALGVDPAAHLYLNLWPDNIEGATHRPGHPVRIHGTTIKTIMSHARMGIIVALGKRVSVELAKRGIVHVALVHPAARGKIRLRANYIAHVRERLAPKLRRGAKP